MSFSARPFPGCSEAQSSQMSSTVSGRAGDAKLPHSMLMAVGASGASPAGRSAHLLTRPTCGGQGHMCVVWRVWVWVVVVAEKD